MQKINEPDNFETDNSKYLKQIIYVIIFIAIIIFKAVAKKKLETIPMKKLKTLMMVNKFNLK